MRKGMTLLELLVVLVTIALLAYLIFSAIAYSRHQAYLAVCLSNLRQLHLAVKMYEEDWGVVPIETRIKTKEGYFGWVQQMLFPTYIRDYEIFLCPSDVYRGERHYVPQWQGRKYPISYGYLVNSVTLEMSNLDARSLPPDTVLFICLHHSITRGVWVLARYDGSIEIAPRGSYKFVTLGYEIKVRE